MAYTVLHTTRKAAPPAAHDCDLPVNATGLFASEPTGSVARCDDCGRTWVSSGQACRFADVWVPMRWWHFRARRQMKQNSPAYKYERE